MKYEIKDIFEELKNHPSEDVLFALHYFTKPLDEIRPELQEKVKSVVEKTLYEQIAELFRDLYEDYERTQPPFQLGVQINISWPNSEDVNNLRTNYPKLKTILQVSDFSSLEERIGRYNVDYILIDTSRGEGIEFKIDEAIGAYNTIYKNNTAIIGFAEGFLPENVQERVSNLKRKLAPEDFCIGAQGRLRGEGYLDMGKVEKYLREAIEAFRQCFSRRLTTQIASQFAKGRTTGEYVACYCLPKFTIANFASQPKRQVKLPHIRLLKKRFII